MEVLAIGLPTPPSTTVFVRLAVPKVLRPAPTSAMAGETAKVVVRLACKMQTQHARKGYAAPSYASRVAIALESGAARVPRSETFAVRER